MQRNGSWPSGHGAVFRSSCGVSIPGVPWCRSTDIDRAVVFAIYTDSYAFVFATAMLQHSFGVNSNLRTCDSAILLCLVCYVTTKVYTSPPDTRDGAC